jgi:hypothetical protein
MTRDTLNSKNVLTITKYIISLQDQGFFVKFKEHAAETGESTLRRKGALDSLK